MSRKQLDRRTFLKRTLQSSALIAVGGAVGSLPMVAEGDQSVVNSSRSLAKAARNPLRIPSDIVGTTLTAQETTAEIFPGYQTDIYGLNGTYLGPTLRFNSNDHFQIQLQNRLSDQDLILHWHGILSPSEMDGHPHQAIGPGENRDYDFQLKQPAGTYWYHSHTDKLTGPQVYHGLAGMMIVHDPIEEELGLPLGEYDVPLILQDRQVSGEYQFIYSLDSQEIMRGVQGDTILVNGTPDPQLDVKQTRYRFRILNAANARLFRVGFADGRTFHLIANDGGLLDRPIELDSFFLPSGARAEILVDFSSDPIGTSPLLQSLSFDGDSFPGTRQGVPADLLQFDVDAAGPDATPLPEEMIPIDPIGETDSIEVRSFKLHKVNLHHAINEKLFELMRVDFDIPMEKPEIWEFVNPTIIIHPMHIHGVQFRIVSRNGSSDDLKPEEMGWKDTVVLFPYDTVQVLVRFTAHTGMFMLHCHNLEHEDDGMMMNFTVSPPLSVSSENSDEADSLDLR